MKTIKLGINVGINHYGRYPQDELRGCVSGDATNIRKFEIVKLGFSQSDIVFLADAKATASEEQSLILNMIDVSGPSHHFVWSHSSHGSNNPDPTQKDGLQELLCCYDIREENGLWVDGFISAKWIGEMIAKLRPQDTMDIILDCCNAPAGSQLKRMGLTYNRARFMRRSLTGIPVKPKSVETIRSSIPKNVALWSACQPEQTSADAYINGQWQGAFTAGFLISHEKGRTRSDIIHYDRRWLADNHYAQIPHLYCWPELAFKGLEE